MCLRPSNSELLKLMVLNILFGFNIFDWPQWVGDKLMEDHHVAGVLVVFPGNSGRKVSCAVTWKLCNATEEFVCILVYTLHEWTWKLFSVTEEFVCILICFLHYSELLKLMVLNIIFRFVIFVGHTAIGGALILPP